MRVHSLISQYNIPAELAQSLEQAGGKFADYGLRWAATVRDLSPSSVAAVSKIADSIAGNPMQDIEIVRELKAAGITPPNTHLDNGPALRSIVRAASISLQYDESRKGAFLNRVHQLHDLGIKHPGVKMVY